MFFSRPTTDCNMASYLGSCYFGRGRVDMTDFGRIPAVVVPGNSRRYFPTAGSCSVAHHICSVPGVSPVSSLAEAL